MNNPFKIPSIEDQINDLLTSVSFNAAKDDDDLDNKYYKDPFLTAEQDKRDEQITRLLSAYVDSYEKKVRGSKWYRRNYFWGLYRYYRSYCWLFDLFRLSSCKLGK